jgi:hypothetical protein
MGHGAARRAEASGKVAQLVRGLLSAVMPRWGNPDGGAFAEFPCGAYIDEETSFAGYTIPSRPRVGWHFGTDRFAKDGEFFRATIDRAVFR